VVRLRRSPHLMIVIHSLHGGGAERVTVDLSEFWRARGYEVTVVTQAGPEHDAYQLHADVRREVLGTAGASGNKLKALYSNLRRLWRLRRLIRKYQPTIILGMMTTSSVLAILAARGLSCRVIATEHTHPPFQDLPSVWKKMRKKAYPQAYKVVALTSDTARWIKESIPGSQVCVIPNAVVWPLAQTDPVVEPPQRGTRKRLLAVGRLHSHKGFDLLLTAFASIQSYFPDWDLVILGEGPDREALQGQVQQLGLDERVAMPGRVGNVGQWYQSSDLYVLSSRVEGLSNTLLESMASGLPVVAFDCDTGPREIVRHGIDGALVSPPEDVDALAAHLSDLMAHPDKRKTLAMRAVDVRDRFSSVRIMALWRQVFEGGNTPEQNKGSSSCAES
jgi:glycosyltransferase involved in cell wall biosynthesis